MRIECGVYTICSDEYCMWITQKIKAKSKNAKKEYSEVRVAGYSRNVEQLLKSFLEGRCRRSGAKDVKTLLKDIDKRDKDLMKIIRKLQSDSKA